MGVHSNVKTLWTCILAFRGNGGTRNAGQYGDRIPALFYNSRDRLLGFRHSVSGNPSYVIDKKIDVGRWYHLEIKQEKKNQNVMYTINLNGAEVHSVVNSDARVFKDVKLFAGDNFYPPADASYKKLIWENLGYSGKIQKNNLLDTIDTWGPNFRVTFDLMVHSNVKSIWTCILAFRGNGGTRNAGQYGDRIPALFYNSRDRLL